MASTHPLADRKARARVFIAHPERQHSDQLAAALADAGMLSLYVHGAPLQPAPASAIPSQLRRRLGFCRWGRWAMHRVIPTRLALEHYYRLIWAFDRLVARRLVGGRFDAVVGYENSAVALFEAAKKRGVFCILDNADVHHLTQDDLLPRQVSDRFHERIVSQKTRELELADIVLTCSQFAFDSFIAGGVPRHKLRLLPLGADVESFTARPLEAKPTGPLRFLFVGRIQAVKGADILATATLGLRALQVPCTLTVAASRTTADADTLGRLDACATLLGQVPHRDLPAVYAAADCLVVPSRFDSFALVVAEALAAGLPVIVSENVGAKDIIVEGVNGWVVPMGDAAALASRMRWCAENPDAVRAMGSAARASAVAQTWSDYRVRAARIVSSAIADAAAPDDLQAQIADAEVPACHATRHRRA